MLTLTPINLKTANAFVQQYHRHHKPTRGHKFSIGVSENGALVGVAICGRLWRGGWTMAIRWKSTVCVQMEHQTPAASCMRRRTVQHGQWVTTELLPTFWIRRMEHP